MKKISVILAAMLVALSLFAVPAFAEESAPPAADIVEESAPETPAETPSESPENGGNSAESESPAPAPNEQEGEDLTVSELLAQWLEEYAAEILSAASVIIGGIVALLFKKGLLPFVSKALNAVSEGTKKLSEQNAAGLAASGIKVEEMRETCEKMASKVDQLEAQLSAATDKNAAVLKCTTEMIGTLLLNLKLTVDQRASVEDAMAEVKAKLGGGEDR